MRILITGAAGRLGRQLRQQLAAAHDLISTDVLGDVDVTVDLTDYEACCRLLRDNGPDIVLHAAAWTDVDGCARDPQRALSANGLATAHLAAHTSNRGIPMLYLSSNEVFDGEMGRPYAEYDWPNPINPYGYSKWYGERALAQVNPRHYIVRTAWLFAHGGGNFIQAILAAAGAGKPLRVVTNEVANPTYANDLAAAIAQLIESERYGIYHLVNKGAVSRWSFARHILDYAGYTATPIERISRHEWQRPSLPPEHTALANNAGASLGIRLRPWQEALRAFMDAEESD